MTGEKERSLLSRSMISESQSRGNSAPTADGRSTPAYQAYRILQLGFVAAPIIAGADKFSHVLVNWDMYLAPSIAKLSPLGGHGLMLLVGIIEIIAGLLVAFRPRVGAYVVAFWLWGIIVNLLLIPGFFDVALCDFGLSLGALALARLSRQFNP
jgi:hypothetical protein